MSARRLSLGTLALLVFFGSAAAQDPTQLLPSEALPNWPAAPFWFLQQSVDVEKAKEGEALDPMVVEGVPTPPLPLTGINPCRIVDTRGNGFTGAYGPPALSQGAPRNFTLTGQCGISGAAQAVSLNITVTNTQGPGFILIYPQGGAQPNVSTLNYVAGQTIANAAVVPLGAGGGVTVVAGVSGTDLIIDTNGYYAPESVVNTINGLSGALTLAAGSNVSITPSGNTLTIASTGGGGSGWSLTGNAGTTPGTNFLGTTDNKAVEFKVNFQRALRLEPTPNTKFGVSPPNVIGGASNNSASAGIYGATIGGGGGIAGANTVTDVYGTVSGGGNNTAGGTNSPESGYATVGGGTSNAATGDLSTIAGGLGNSTIAAESSILGGSDNDINSATAYWATIGGGLNNVAGGVAATVPGGRLNLASGVTSFSAGHRAKATHAGSFVWGDSTDADVSSAGVNHFVARARGGFTFYPDASTTCTLTSVSGWNCVGISDRSLKKEFAPVDARDTLARLVSVPIQSWSYLDQQPSIRHMGPMAQDFSAAYGLGGDDRTINPLDANGVALAAIQGLYEEVQELKKRLAALEAEKD